RLEHRVEIAEVRAAQQQAAEALGPRRPGAQAFGREQPVGVEQVALARIQSAPARVGTGAEVYGAAARRARGLQGADAQAAVEQAQVGRETGDRRRDLGLAAGG